MSKLLLKRHRVLLELAFAEEINAALDGGRSAGLIQKDTIASRELVSEGLLEGAEVELGGRFPVVVKGLRLTEAGRLAYCLSCDDEEEP